MSALSCYPQSAEYEAILHNTHHKVTKKRSISYLKLKQMTSHKQGNFGTVEAHSLNWTISRFMKHKRE